MKTKNAKSFKFLLKLFLIIIVFAIIIAMISLFSIYYSAKLNTQTIISPKAHVEIYDCNGELIENKQLNKYVKFDDISPNIINAFVALEDKRFYKHNGVDYYRLMGALIKDIKSRSFKEGGSTITQQLAKNTQLSSEKTIKRKIKELRLARLIEKKYTKNQILEMYLNAIYFGNGIYGIDGACKNYFNKSPQNLTPAESALLAGIVKSPKKYSPKNNINNALERRNLVLKLMLEQNYITKNIYEYSIKEFYSVPNDIYATQICTPYYSNAIHEASTILGISEKELITNDYKIYTYYDKTQQNILHNIFTSNEYASINSNGIKAQQSAIISNNSTGGIASLYSTTDTDIFSLRRQPASTIKPILVYAPAIEKGLISPSSYFLDEKININGYSPKNFSNSYAGWVTAKTALKKSINTVAVKIFDTIGKDNAFKFAENCGLKLSPIDNTASALGGLTYGSTIIELNEAYMTLANLGIYKKNTLISKITTNNGDVLYKHNSFPKRSMCADTAFLVTNMLSECVQSGTATKLKGFSFDIASKTGTAQSTKSNGNIDAWNISYTTEHTITVWYGDTENQSNTALEITGSSLPTMLARKIHSKLPKPIQKKFTIPSTIFTLDIDLYAGEKEHNIYLTNNYTPLKYRETAYFSIKNCPIEHSPYFDINNIDFQLNIENKNVSVLINNTNEPYTIYLEETDLINNLIKLIPIENNCKTTFSPIEHGKIMNYRLAVYYENQFLGYTENKLIFT